MGRLEEIRSQLAATRRDLEIEGMAFSPGEYSEKGIYEEDVADLLERISELEAENERLRGHFEVEGEGLRCNVCGRWDGFNML